MFDIFYIGEKPGLFAHEKPADCIEQARQLSLTRYLWVVHAANDYSGFDWHWEPVPWQSHQAHVWPSQHQANGGTWLLPKQGHTDVNRHHPVLCRSWSVPRVHVKHISDSPDFGQVNTRYVADYLGTLKRVLAKVPWQHCWITTDVCDYASFDFTWHPSEWQSEMLHVFASGQQKFGDTFYVHVPSFLQKTQDLALLEWFDTINFVEDISVPRVPAPVVMYDSDSVIPAVWQHEFQHPVVEFSRYQAVDSQPAINLWRPQTKAVTPLRAGSESVMIPREVKRAINSQIYDYAVIDRVAMQLPSTALDIVFISNGESTADENWARLLWQKQGSPNRCVRVDGVNGRAAAYQAAAETSQTDWFFAVFAKLRVSDDFDWSWQPDRLQQAKHYIFHARNPVNHLVYGHQAMIAYNRRLVMANTGQGLDFTLDDAHEVVPVVSGTACYNDDPWTCWRTAFREALKLRHSWPDVENEYRLQQWRTVGDGVNGHWSCLGAEDAVNYYDQTQGRFEDLKRSYEWAWLASYAMLLHPELFTESNS